MDRVITRLACLQVFLIVSGFFCLGIYMKMNGYPDKNYLIWSDTAIFLRNHGFWLILIPLFWTGFSFKVQNKSQDNDKIILLSGIILNAAIILSFIIATISHRHPLIIAL